MKDPLKQWMLALDTHWKLQKILMTGCTILEYDIIGLGRGICIWGDHFESFLDNFNRYLRFHLPMAVIIAKPKKQTTTTAEKKTTSKILWEQLEDVDSCPADNLHPLNFLPGYPLLISFLISWEWSLGIIESHIVVSATSVSE